MTTPQPRRRAPGVAAPGAPPRGTPGSFSLLGQNVTVNAAGIITKGPWRGRYPAQVIQQYGPRRPEAPVPRAGASPLPAATDPAAEYNARLNLQREQQEAQRREGERSARTNAYARLTEVLNDYGLGTLAGSVQTWLQEGLSEAEITQRMRDTNEFKSRFPAIEERKRKGLSPISPGEYVAYERNARQLLRAAGIPEGFYDSNEDFQRFLSNDLSIAELGDRVTLAANAAFRMDPAARDALTQWGMGPGDLTAFWLDPDKATPLLERKYVAAQLAGAGTRSGFGRLNENEATQLATLGVTPDQAEQGFGNLVDARELFTSLDRTEDNISRTEHLGAAFGGNANAKRRIEQRARKRSAQFEAGGGYASSQGGLVGLGESGDR
jgi:hypothetical protein